MRRLITGTNYCGPGGDGPVLNELDAACEQHDKDYGEQGYSSYLANQDADKMFLRRIANITPGSLRERLTRAIAIGYFTGKVTMVDAIKKITGMRQSKLKDYGFTRRSPATYPPGKRRRYVSNKIGRTSYQDFMDKHSWKKKALTQYKLYTKAYHAEKALKAKGLRLKQKFGANYSGTNKTRYFRRKRRYRRRY